jgi:hypothetical protein
MDFSINSTELSSYDGINTKENVSLAMVPAQYPSIKMKQWCPSIDAVISSRETVKFD